MSLLDRLARSRAAGPPDPDRCVLPTSDADGVEHHVHRWPLVPGHPGALLRPSILGDAFRAVRLWDADALAAVLPGLGLARAPTGGALVFLDCETTGLLDTGAVAFVIGLGRVDGDEFEVEQWTLRSIAAEDRLLRAVLDRIAAVGGVLATFNGASFDLPFLRRRAGRLGLDPAPLELPHLDLLPVARRVWRGLQPDCRLVTLERSRLGVERVDDLPGELVPAAFWAALRRPDDPDSERWLARVRMHNEADVVALAALVPRLVDAIEAPADPSAAIRAARHLVRLGDSRGALERLAPFVEPDRIAADSEGATAVALAARLCRRLGEHDRAASLWRSLCERRPGDPEASDALAKHLEHRCRDARAALQVAAASRQPCPRRLARLERKLSASARL